MIGALGVRSFYCKFTEKVNQEEVIEFLKELKRKRGKFILLIDNAKWHKSRKVKHFADKHKLKLVFFLPYTPELNPIETRWKEIKNELGNKLFYDVGEMMDVITKKIGEREFFTNKFYQYLCS